MPVQEGKKRPSRSAKLVVMSETTWRKWQNPDWKNLTHEFHGARRMGKKRLIAVLRVFYTRNKAATAQLQPINWILADAYGRACLKNLEMSGGVPTPPHPLICPGLCCYNPNSNVFILITCVRYLCKGWDSLLRLSVGQFWWMDPIELWPTIECFILVWSRASKGKGVWFRLSGEEMVRGGLRGRRGWCVSP